MTHAELPPSIPHASGSSSGNTPGVELVLPAGLRALVPALVVWSTVDQARYRLTSRCLGETDPGVEWADFVAAAAGAGLLDPDGVGYRLRPEWVPSSELGLERLGGADAVRSRLVECWLADRDPTLAPEIAIWAGALHRWDVVEETWIILNEHTGVTTTEALALYRDLPPEARRERPILTWSSAAAASALAPTPAQQVEAAVERSLFDAATLHTDWATRDDVDVAVFAGSMRMMGERRLPSTRPGQSLDAAWRTKQEIDAYIDARSREGRSPGRRCHGLFRAFSSRLALARGDLAAAISEAQWAMILSDRTPVARLGHGVHTLATSLIGESEPVHVAGEKPDRIRHELGVRGLGGMGAALEILADAHHAVRSLDRAEAERTLALVSPLEAAIAGVWAIRASAEALRAALWGDPAEGLRRLFADIGKEATLSREQDETLGGMLLARARLLLLTKAGAFAAADQFAESLPDVVRLVPQARAYLWSGRFTDAIRLTDAAPFQPGLTVADRPKLALIRAAALILAGSPDQNLAGGAVEALGTLLANRNYQPVATMPKPAREAIIALCEPQLGDDPSFLEMVERLSGLNDADDQRVRPVRLTEREKVLLPLLAGPAAVPEIARALHVSVNTVRKQVVTLREKFGAETRAELIRRARNHGALAAGDEAGAPGPGRS